MDGLNFKDIQLALPIYRQKAPYKGLTLVEAAQKASELRAGGEKSDLLSPITINDKIGTVSLFFEWGKSRDSSVVNPTAEQQYSALQKQAQRQKSDILGALTNSIACSPQTDGATSR